MQKLSATTLKYLALITMTIDHIGLFLLNNYTPFRIIGRLSFPIFGYLIAEGCRYTHNRRAYFLRVSILAIICQIVMYFATHSLYMSILISFSLSLLLIMSIDYTLETKHWLISIFSIFLVFFLVCLLPLQTTSDYQIDYGIGGIILVVMVYYLPEKWRLLGVLVGCLFMSVTMTNIQYFSLLAIIPLAFYNHKKGKGSPLPYFFYLYYPLHLAIIYLLAASL